MGRRGRVLLCHHNVVFKVDAYRSRTSRRSGWVCGADLLVAGPALKDFDRPKGFEATDRLVFQSLNAKSMCFAGRIDNQIFDGVVVHSALAITFCLVESAMNGSSTPIGAPVAPLSPNNDLRHRPQGDYAGDLIGDATTTPGVGGLTTLIATLARLAPATLSIKAVTMINRISSALLPKSIVEELTA